MLVSQTQDVQVLAMRCPPGLWTGQSSTEGFSQTWIAPRSSLSACTGSKVRGVVCLLGKWHGDALRDTFKGTQQTRRRLTPFASCACECNLIHLIQFVSVWTNKAEHVSLGCILPPFRADTLAPWRLSRSSPHWGQKRRCHSMSGHRASVCRSDGILHELRDTFPHHQHKQAHPAVNHRFQNDQPPLMYNVLHNFLVFMESPVMEFKHGHSAKPITTPQHWNTTMAFVATQNSQQPSGLSHRGQRGPIKRRNSVHVKQVSWPQFHQTKLAIFCNDYGIGTCNRTALFSTLTHAKSHLSCGLHSWPETVPSSLARTRPVQNRRKTWANLQKAVKNVKSRESYMLHLAVLSSSGAQTGRLECCKSLAQLKAHDILSEPLPANGPMTSGPWETSHKLIFSQTWSQSLHTRLWADVNRSVFCHHWLLQFPSEIHTMPLVTPDPGHKVMDSNKGTCFVKCHDSFRILSQTVLQDGAPCLSMHCDGLLNV